MPMIGIVVAVLLGFTALAVDVGYLRYQQRIQQEAVDSAALAGATELLAGKNYVNAAKADAASNGFTDNGSTIQVSAVNPPSTGNYTTDSNAVQATIVAQRSLFFASVMGFGAMPMTTRAVATVNGTDNGCMYMLDPNAGNNFNAPGGGNGGGAGNLTANCSLVFNGTTNFHSATVSATSVNCAQTCSNITVPYKTIVPATDPCSRITVCAYMTNNPPAVPASCPSFSGNGTMTPGCYGGINVRNKTVRLSPGLYIITGTFNADGATLSGTGVTLYITGSGKLQWNSSSINLSAPTGTSNYTEFAQGESNVLLFENPSDTNNATIQSSTCGSPCGTTLSGLLYFPTQQVNYNMSNSTTAGMIIFGSGNFNGSTTVVQGPAAGSPLIPSRIVLAE